MMYKQGETQIFKGTTLEEERINSLKLIGMNKERLLSMINDKLGSRLTILEPFGDITDAKTFSSDSEVAVVVKKASNSYYDAWTTELLRNDHDLFLDEVGYITVKVYN